jgi:hypothetical protein
VSGKVAGFILPGYDNPTGWDSSQTLGYPAAIAAINGNWVAIQSNYQTSNWTSTNVDSSTALPDQTVQDLITSARAAGMKVCLKPHLVMSDSTTQSLFIPGAQFSRTLGSNSSATNATYSSGQNTISSVSWNLTNANVGDRVVSPGVGHTNEIPNSGYATPYATGPAPNYTIISSVTNATHAVLSANATASTGSGQAAVLHDADAATWFTNWTTTMDHLLSVADAVGGVDAINLSTEHEWCTRYYPSNWRTLISHITASRPALKVYVQTSEGLTYGADIPFVDACDYIGMSAYPTVGTHIGGDPQYYVTNNWIGAITHMAAYAAAWNTPIIWGEVGARSIQGAGYQPYQSAQTSGQSPDVDQNAFVTAFLYACWYQSWFAGFFWWTWYGPAGSRETDSFSPKTLSMATFTGFLPNGDFPARLALDNAGNRVRRIG